jgi:hypothetical protein
VRRAVRVPQWRGELDMPKISEERVSICPRCPDATEPEAIARLWRFRRDGVQTSRLRCKPCGQSWKRVEFACDEAEA